LKRRIAEIHDGRFDPDADRTTFTDLATVITNHYSGKRSRDRVALALQHLRAHLGLCRVKALSYTRLDAYVAARRDEGTAEASIKYELAILRKGLRLLATAGKLVRLPAIPTITVNNARDVFFEDWELAALLGELPDDLKAPVRFAAETGWRLQSEVLPLEWDQVDLDAGLVRLHLRSTKNADARTYPVGEDPALLALLEAQRAETDRWEQALGRVVPWVFHRQGQPIKDLRTAWRAACRRAGVLGRDGRPKVPHDLRRSAIRRLEREGVPRSWAMQLVGHRTEAVYSRYCITTDRDLREAVRRKLGHSSTILGRESGRPAPEGAVARED
jgi:integrase